MTRLPLTEDALLDLLVSGVYRVCPDTGRVTRRTQKGYRAVRPWVKESGRRYVKIYGGTRKCRFVALAKLVWMSVTHCTVPIGWEIYHRDLHNDHDTWTNVVCRHPLDHRKEHFAHVGEPIPE